MNNLRFFKLLFIATLISIFLISCNTTDNVEPTDETITTEEASATDFPIEITDSTDNTITLEKKPERIISVMPSNTEILFALELGDQVIGVTENDTYPEEVFEIETVGDFEINVEKIISLEPDLVLAHASSIASSFDAYEQLKEANIPVYFVSDAQSIEETYGTIEEIGKVTGASDVADVLISEMKNGFKEVEAVAEQINVDQRKTVLFEISPEPEIFTGGKGTFFNELIELIQADNAAAEIEGWAQLDPEAIVELNPDVILTLYGSYVENATEQVLNREGFSEVNAVKNGQVFDIDEDIVSRPGPRLVEGAKEIGKFVYPEYFND